MIPGLNLKKSQKPKAKKKGAATTRNIGIENVFGQFIQYLDSDDSMAFDKFEVQINRLKNEFPQTLATCRYGISRPPFFQPKICNGLKTFRDFKNPFNLFRVFAENFTFFPLHTYLIPLTIIEKAGKWNEDLSVNDYGKYFSRIILNSSQIVFCNKTYVVYRTGAGNRISTKITKPSGVQSYIQGWNLIDENIYDKTGIKNHLYVQSAKSNLYERLHRENKPLITIHEAFLKGRWSNPSYFFAKLVNKVRSKLLIYFTKK